MTWSITLRLAALCAAALACARTGDSKERATAAAPAAAASGTSAPAGAAAATRATDVDSALLKRADAGRIIGDTTAKVWVVMVSDFQCPFCKMWHDSTYEAVRHEYLDNGKIRMAYINFPLQMHQHALPAAEAAMCAAEQGKFWPMHDRLFDSQKAWEKMKDARMYFDSLARSVGVDAPRFRICTMGHKTMALVQGDYERAANARVNATPTFFIGPKTTLSGAQPIAEMRKAIDAALAQASGRP